MTTPTNENTATCGHEKHPNWRTCPWCLDPANNDSCDDNPGHLGRFSDGTPTLR